MPKYYCDYCDIFLTHDSPAVRRSHNDGWKHKQAVRFYYSQFEEDQTQSLIDQKIKEFEGKSQSAFHTHIGPYGIMPNSTPSYPSAPASYPSAPTASAYPMPPPFLPPPFYPGPGLLNAPGGMKRRREEEGE